MVLLICCQLQLLVVLPYLSAASLGT